MSVDNQVGVSSQQRARTPCARSAGAPTGASSGARMRATAALAQSRVLQCHPPCSCAAALRGAAVHAVAPCFLRAGCCSASPPRSCAGRCCSARGGPLLAQSRVLQCHPPRSCAAALRGAVVHAVAPCLLRAGCCSASPPRSCAAALGGAAVHAVAPCSCALGGVP